MCTYKYWLLSFLLLIFTVPHAHAICPLTDYRKDFLNSDSVFVGKMISRDEKQNLSKLHVSYVWKGNMSADQTVRVPGIVSDQFNKDDNGLYYANIDTDGLLFTDPCKRTQPLDEASEFTMLLFMNAGFWLAFIFLLRFCFIFTYRFLSLSVFPLLCSLLVATGLSFFVPDALIHSLALPFIAQLAVIPALFLACSIAGLAIGMSRKEIPASADSIKPFIILLTIFAAGEIAVAVFFQPVTAVMSAVTALLIADSWRSGIRFEPVERAMKHRMRSTILILVSFALMIVVVGIFFHRWMSL